jgi:MFS family permease
MSTLAAPGVSLPQTPPVYLSRPAPGIIAALLCGYLAVGLPLPVIPLFVHDQLGFSTLIVGLVIGIQFLATVLTRGYAGRLTDQHGGKRSMLQGAVVCALGGLLYLIAALPGFSPAISPAGQRLPFYRVIGQIWREGLGLMLQGVGLSGLTAFASLYFAARHWDHAGWVMTAFGTGFIFVRVVLGSLPDRMSGYRVALSSLLVEALGQAMLWGAQHEIVALAGALVTGLGCALVFPALGVEALKRVLPANRGSAMGAFVAFLDIAYGLSGPAAGVIAGHFDYAAVYLFGAGCALLGVVLMVATRN